MSRALDLARATFRIARENNGAVGFRDLRQAGFSNAEILEHHEAADAMLSGLFQDACAAVAAAALIVGVPLFLAGIAP